MRRAGGWLLGAMALSIMAAGAWLGLSPFLRREDAILLFVRPVSAPAPSADAIGSGLRMALGESHHRAGRFRIKLEDAGRPLESQPLLLVAAHPDRTLVEVPLVVSALETRAEMAGFRLLPSTERQGRAAADWAGRLGARRAMVVGENENPRSQLIVESFQERAREAGLPVVASELFPRPPEELAHEALASRADLVFFGGEDPPYTHARQLFGALRGGGYAGRLMLGDASPEVSFLEAPGPLPEGTFLVSPLAPPPAGFAEKYLAFAGKPAGPHVHYGYLAGRAVLEVLERAENGARESIHRAFAQLPHFDANGDTATNSAAGYVVREGRFRFLELLR